MGRRHTKRDSVVGSDFTLPAMVSVALLVWLVFAPHDWRAWAGAGMALLTAYLLMELNNRYALLRIRSRLVSVVFLLLALSVPALHGWRAELAPPLCLAAGFFLLFPAYQLRRAEGYAFHAFLLLGLGGMFFPPVLFLAPVYFFCMLVWLRCLTLRSFFAGLLGLLVPFWVYAAYAVWGNRLDTAFVRFGEWIPAAAPDYSFLTLPQLVTAAVLLFYIAVSIAHFYHTAYNDKIRTRMFFHVFVAVEFFLLAGMLLLPQCYDNWLPLLLVNSAPLLAHYFALARGRGFGVWFWLSFALFVALAVFNHLVAYGPLAYLGGVRPLGGVTLW